MVLMMLGAYVAAVRFAAQGPDLDISIESMEHLPPTKEIFKTGIHYVVHHTSSACSWMPFPGCDRVSKLN